jgi:hypothetical protein
MFVIIVEILGEKIKNETKMYEKKNKMIKND